MIPSPYACCLEGIRVARHVYRTVVKAHESAARIDAIGNMGGNRGRLRDCDRRVVQLDRLWVQARAKDGDGIVTGVDVDIVAIDRVIEDLAGPNENAIAVADNLKAAQISRDVFRRAPLHADQRLVQPVGERAFQSQVLNHGLVVERERGGAVVALWTTAGDLGELLTGAGHREAIGKLDVFELTHREREWAEDDLVEVLRGG